MLKRVNRQSIANFVMCGSETLRFAEGSFDERLRKSESLVSKCLDELGLTEREKDELTAKEGDLLNLYFQEGVKVGALLLRSLTE